MYCKYLFCVCCLSILSIMYFDEEKFSILILSILLVYDLWLVLWVSCLRKSAPHKIMIFFSTFVSRNFIILPFIFVSAFTWNRFLCMLWGRGQNSHFFPAWHSVDWVPFIDKGIFSSLQDSTTFISIKFSVMCDLTDQFI